MSIRRYPPPAPNHPQRAGKLEFAQIEFCRSGRVFEVHVEELSVGGATVEFVGLTPPTKYVGDRLEVFIDVGANIEGERVAGTIRAELIVLQPGTRGKRPRALLMWSGADPSATLVVNRLLTQTIANLWNETERCRALERQAA